MKLTIKGVEVFDGEYELDLTRGYTGNELHFIKKMSGVRLGEIQEAAAAGDYDLMIALAVIAVWRDGTKGVTKESAVRAAEALLAEDSGFLTIDVGEGDDAGPPEPTASSSGNDSNSEYSSASSSSTGDDPPETTPPSTGLPSSEPTSASDLATSAT